MKFNLAIETTSRAGEIALGRADELVATAALPAQRRHDVGLMPGIDGLCRAHGVTPGELGEVYVSLGPGSFTGLRVAVAAAKMLALAGGVKLVGVETLEVVAHNAPAEHVHVAAGLNLKRSTLYCAAYRRDQGALEPVVEPALRTLDALLDASPRPLALVGETLPELPDEGACAGEGGGVTLLDTACGRPRAATVWRLGRALAAAGRYTDAMTIEPLYVRRPEAVELWERR